MTDVQIAHIFVFGAHSGSERVYSSNSGGYIENMKLIFEENCLLNMNFLARIVLLFVKMKKFEPLIVPNDTKNLTNTKLMKITQNQCDRENLVIYMLN